YASQWTRDSRRSALEAASIFRRVVHSLKPLDGLRNTVDGKDEFLFPEMNGPLERVHSDGELLICHRTNSPFVWSTLDAERRRIKIDRQFDDFGQKNPLYRPKFFAHSAKKDWFGKRWFVFDDDVRLLSDDQVNWEDHTAKIPLN
ncbi:MAG: hypothetical protein WD065_14465, partial [Planctomycetaceae bacterium]